MNAFLLQRVLQRQCIDDRGHHAHVVAGRAIDFKSLLPRTAKNISAADNQRNLHAEVVHFLQFARDGLNRFAVNAVSLWSLQRLAGNLEQNSLIDRFLFRAFLRGTLFRWHGSPRLPVKSRKIVANSPRAYTQVSQKKSVPTRSERSGMYKWNAISA